MLIYDRKNKKFIEEIEYKQNLLNFLYKNLMGRLLLKTVVARPWFNKLKAKYYYSNNSKKDIIPFVKEHNVDVSYWNIDDFKNFNDFFTRKKEIKINNEPKNLISIADSKLMVYKINENLNLKIKNSKYDLKDIICDENIVKEYKNGYCLVFRLSVYYYHRYIYFDTGKLKEHKKIKGELHTVRSISEKYKVFSRNSREVSILETDNLGTVIQVEVGALLVGAINNHNIFAFKKGEEKGFFEFGGSTIVLILKENSVIIDNDIIENSKKGIESKVCIGEKIGLIKDEQ